MLNACVILCVLRAEGEKIMWLAGEISGSRSFVPSAFLAEQTHFTRAFIIRPHIRHPRIVNERNILFLFVNSI